MNLLKKFWWRFFSTKRPFRLTKGGWVFILYTVGVGAGSINTGNNLLYLIFGLFLGIILASGVLSDLTLWGLEIQLHLPESIQHSRPGILGFQIINHKKRVPSLSLTIELEGVIRGKKVKVVKFIPALAAKKSSPSHFVVLAPERGWFKINTVRTATRFPFGLLYKWWTKIKDGGGLVVHPAPSRDFVDPISSHRPGQEDSSQQSQKGEGSTVYDIRRYQPGDNPKRIHWKASAKRAELLLREMETDEKKEAWLLWPTLEHVRRMEHKDREKFVQLTVDVIETFRLGGKKPRLLLASGNSADSQIFYEVTPMPNKDQTQALLRFLALFDDPQCKPQHQGYQLHPVAPPHRKMISLLEVAHAA